MDKDFYTLNEIYSGMHSKEDILDEASAIDDVSNIKITYWQSSSTSHTYKVFFDDKLSVEGRSLKHVAYLAAKALKSPYNVILDRLNAIKVHTWIKSRDWYLRNKEYQDRLADVYDDLGSHRRS